MMSFQEKTDVSIKMKKTVIVKTQTTLNTDMLIDPPLPQLGYCTRRLSVTILYKMQNDTGYLSDL